MSASTCLYLPGSQLHLRYLVETYSDATLSFFKKDFLHFGAAHKCIIFRGLNIAILRKIALKLFVEIFTDHLKLKDSE